MEGAFFIFKGRIWRYMGNAIFVQGEIVKMANGNQYAVEFIHYDPDNQITYYHLALVYYTNEYGSYDLRMKGHERSEVFTRKKHYSKDKFSNWYKSQYGAEQEGLY